MLITPPKVSIFCSGAKAVSDCFGSSTDQKATSEFSTATLAQSALSFASAPVWQPVYRPVSAIRLGSRAVPDPEPEPPPR